MTAVADVARQRYNAAFTSTIFEAPPQRRPDSAFVPAGKRRDQTTGELFGNYEEKDLRSMPKTFVPKEDNRTAREIKMQFLSSDVLPRTAYAQEDQRSYARGRGGYAAAADRSKSALFKQAEEEDGQVDLQAIKQYHLSSNMFGRETPNLINNQDRSNRLVPNDYVWHSHPEPVNPRQDVSHTDRAYKQKCSSVFDHQSCDVRGDVAAARRQEKEEELIGDQKRRANAHYSDLFGRAAEYDAQDALSPRRPRIRGSHEDQHIVHQDWTDSRTELLRRGPSSPKPDQPHLRKHDELHQARIFGPDGAPDRGDWQPVERADPVTFDNSHKLRSSPGMTTQQIHQAHLRTSMQDPEFYQVAEASRDWEVIELHVSGLPYDADDDRLRSLCQGFDLQIVKCKVDMDPVRNLCKGRAKVTVRYNPSRESIEGLVNKLEAAKLTVEL